MTNFNHISISGDGAAALRLPPPPPPPAATTQQQLVPYFSPHSPPKKKRRTKVFQVETPAPARQRKPDPREPKITRPCTECGKTFWSWKALFGHMRCHPERQWRGINPPANLRRPETSPCGGAEDMTEVDHEVADCLLMLANGPCLKAEKEGSLISINPNPNIDSTNPAYDELMTSSGDGFGFECSSCKKVFGSHQALGGHRASHKNVKGCFAICRGSAVAADSGGDVAEDGGREITVAGFGHKCGICLRVFSTGQALGGHKRCHFEKGGLNCLDLNLPALIEDNDFNDPFSCFPLDLGLRIR